MNEPVKFKCPRCGCEANAYSQVFAGCVGCGVLFYTDIPQEVKSQLTQRALDAAKAAPKTVVTKQNILAALEGIRNPQRK